MYISELPECEKIVSTNKLTPPRLYTDKDMLAVALHSFVHSLHPCGAFNIAENIIENLSSKELLCLIDRTDKLSSDSYHRSAASFEDKARLFRLTGRERRTRRLLCDEIAEARLRYVSRLKDRNLRDIKICWISENGFEPLVWVRNGEWETMAQLWARRYAEEPWNPRTHEAGFNVVLSEAELDGLVDATSNWPMQFTENISWDLAIGQEAATPSNQNKVQVCPSASPEQSNGTISVARENQQISADHPRLKVSDPVRVKGRRSSWLIYSSAIDTIAVRSHIASHELQRRIQKIAQHDIVLSRIVNKQGTSSNIAMTGHQRQKFPQGERRARSNQKKRTATAYLLATQRPETKTMVPRYCNNEGHGQMSSPDQYKWQDTVEPTATRAPPARSVKFASPVYNCLPTQEQDQTPLRKHSDVSPGASTLLVASRHHSLQHLGFGAARDELIRRKTIGAADVREEEHDIGESTSDMGKLQRKHKLKAWKPSQSGHSVPELSFAKITPQEPLMISSLSTSLREAYQPPITCSPSSFTAQALRQKEARAFSLPRIQTFHPQSLTEKSPIESSLSPAIATPIFVQPGRKSYFSLGGSKVDEVMSPESISSKRNLSEDTNYEAILPANFTTDDSPRMITTETRSQTFPVPHQVSISPGDSIEPICEVAPSGIKSRVDSAISIYECSPRNGDTKSNKTMQLDSQRRPKPTAANIPPLSRARSFPIARKKSKTVFLRKKR